MGISTKLAKQFDQLDEKSKKKLVKMAWEDRVSYKEIKKIFEFSPNDVEKFMRYQLDLKDFKRWKLRQAKRFSLKSKKAAQLKLTDKKVDY